MALSGGGHPARTARSQGREGRIDPRQIGVQRSRRTTFMARSPAWMITKETPAAALAFRCMRRSTVAHWRLHHPSPSPSHDIGHSHAATALDTWIRPGASASGWGTTTSKNTIGSDGRTSNSSPPVQRRPSLSIHAARRLRLVRWHHCGTAQVRAVGSQHGSQPAMIQLLTGLVRGGCQRRALPPRQRHQDLEAHAARPPTPAQRCTAGGGGLPRPSTNQGRRPIGSTTEDLAASWTPLTLFGRSWMGRLRAAC
jgi:hypothetical protein